MIRWKEKKLCRRLLIGLLAVGLCLWLWLSNILPGLTQYRVACPGLPQSFAGFRIAQISDFHNAVFGEENGRLLRLLEKARPDIIVFTGDLVDSRHTDYDVALAFVRQAVRIAPCYYVTGNHEARLRKPQVLLDGLRDAGVQVLRNEAVLLEQDGQKLKLVGMDDCTFFPGKSGEDMLLAMEDRLQTLLGQEYTILLAHRAELIGVYSRNDVDLVFSGHAHGGQIRLPFVGGLYAPDQGTLPEYDSGVHTMGATTLVISRGLGNSVFPLRVNNPPEVVLAILEPIP